MFNTRRAVELADDALFRVEEWLNGRSEVPKEDDLVVSVQYLISEWARYKMNCEDVLALSMRDRLHTIIEEMESLI